ncbi:Bcr/CflA family efflux MFS transporter [Streptomyces ipomoeae]|uniref:Bcr/CflA family efflux MFS transporter n=1 Tax=Streptomyces ipomoeae TaxID=103232 RepID=A0AAE8W7T5_9ACTN|nr:multidrug effflux MFS transporter [Streptomyces ipomoeae]TQE32569.1 Bcr/CflA family efflux MFS transporter [Streptomyces ipomoeae]TQE37188.1 Bcr/CflA family efflux MFS transporter [Streptomyces ipomoeae]
MPLRSRRGSRAIRSGSRAYGESGVPTPTLLALALAYAVAPLATDMYLSAFPRMIDDLGTGVSGVQLTLTAFMVGLATGQLLIGPLSDRWGRRRPMLAGTAVSALAGLLCALAPSVELLTAARFLQGFGGAAGIVIARAVITDRTAETGTRAAGTAGSGAAARAFGILVITGGVAPVVAPLIGGAVLGAAGWRGIFLVLTALAVLTCCGVFVRVPETLPPRLRHGGGLTTTFRTMGGLFSDRSYLGYALAYGFGFGVLYSYLAASPFVYQHVYGLSTGAYTVALAVNAFGFTSTGAVNRRIVGRFGPRALLRVGLTAMLICCAVLCVLAAKGRPPFLPAVVLIYLTASSLGLVAANATALATARAPHAAGSASALLGALQFGLAALVAPLVGLGGEGTALPMAATMTASVCVASLGGLLLARRDRPPREGGRTDVGVVQAGPSQDGG